MASINLNYIAKIWGTCRTCEVMGLLTELGPWCTKAVGTENPEGLTYVWYYACPLPT
jgi:hypothetical protein